jgi:hypothetical protein
MAKALSSIAVVLICTFGLAEVVSRLIVFDVQGIDYLLRKPWRYILPFDYSGNPVVKKGSEGEGYRVYDSLLGWSHGRWSRSEGFFSDNDGFRIGESAFKQRTPGLRHYDIACIGNSFTHGDAVSCEDSWPHILSKSTGRTVVNMGVGGYGIDQAVLRFMRSGTTCDTVILGLVPGDLERSLTTVYNYYTGGVKTKPRFHFHADGSHSLLNVPCLSPSEFVARPLTPRAETVYNGIAGYNGYVSKEGRWWTGSMFFRLIYSSIEQARHRRPPVYMTPGRDLDYCLRIFDLFKRHCDSVGTVPIVLLIDNLNSIADRRKADGNTWAHLQKRLGAMGLVSYQFQDSLMRAYDSDPGALIHPQEKVHYSPSGNRLLTELLAARL